MERHDALGTLILESASVLSGAQLHHLDAIDLPDALGPNLSKFPCPCACARRQ